MTSDPTASGAWAADPLTTDARLRRLLGADELAWLVDRVRGRLERGGPVAGTVTLAEASAAQRDAVERLLGRRPRPGATLSVRLDDVDDVLRRSGMHPPGLASAVVALTGPVRDRATATAEREAVWHAAFAPLDALVAECPELHGWADGLRATGVVRRVAGDPDVAAVLLADLAAALGALPPEPEPVGRFAERVLGHAHALDADRPLTGLVFGAARILGGTPDGEGAAWRREVWASVGLLRDELSTTVLVLGLPGDTATVTGRALAAHADAGEPAVLTLRQLTRHPSAWRLAGHTVSVCENPVVVAEAADRLGPASAPLVCVGGQPGAAAMALLRAAVAAGARLRYHGDFDWGGLRIGNVLFGRLPIGPWRYDTASYHAAVTLGPGRTLTGVPVDASWDAELGEAMRREGHAVEEERVLDDLVADLATPASAGLMSGVAPHGQFPTPHVPRC